MAIVYKNVSLVRNGKKYLDDINLEIEENTVTAIIGNSGSGKTLLAETISGIVIPTTGEIKLYDFTISAKKNIKNINNYRKHIGYSPQNNGESFFSKTVRDEIELVLKNYKYSREQMDYKVKEISEIMNFDKNFLLRNPLNLSSGESRLVMIASAIAHNPNLIILDEVTAGLDCSNKKLVINLIKRLKEEYGKTVILISNDVDLLIKFVDNVVVIDNGKIISSGKKMDVFTNTEIFDKYNIELPSIIQFSKLVSEKKNKKIGYYDDIKDLMKAVYRNV